MIEFRAIPRKWGNSIGITLPNDIVEEGNIKTEKEIDVLIVEKKVNLKKIFGSLKLKESTQKIKEKMKEGWEPEH
jgi:antitoxin component of MazEF toxin-antitoxin module